MKSNKKVLVVLNTAGITGIEREKENIPHYSKVLQSIFDQDWRDSYKRRKFDLVVSSCQNSEWWINQLLFFQGRLHINWIKDRLPVNLTFNHTVLQAVKLLGRYDAYLYLDSGVWFTNNNQLEQLYDLLMNGPYSMVAAQTDDDTGFHQWFGTGQDDHDVTANQQLFKDGHFIIPVGKAINLHCQLFAHGLLDFYGKILPDIFAGHCSESVLSFIAAAVRSQWVVHKDVILSHKRDVDGQSSGFSPAKWVSEGKSRFDHPFVIKSIFERLIPGQPIGMSYEGGMIPLKEDEFDSEGYCKNDQLQCFIRDNVFLRPDEFDYSKVNSLWIS